MYRSLLCFSLHLIWPPSASTRQHQHNPQYRPHSSSSNIRDPKALRSTLGKTPQSRKIDQQRPDGMVHEPSLHMLPIILLHLLLRLRAGRHTAVNHLLDRATNQRPEDKMASGQERAVRVPVAHISRLEG